MQCAHCRTRQATLTCGLCHKVHYCRKRCQYMDYEIGLHAHACKASWYIACPSLSVKRGPSLTVRRSTDLDQSALPQVFRTDRDFAHALDYVAYQAPPHVTAFALPRFPYLAALELVPAGSEKTQQDEVDALSQWRLALPPAAPPDSNILAEIHGADSVGRGLLLVPRIVDAVYVLLGEEDFDVVHPASDTRPAHRFVGAAVWWEPNSRAELVAYARALGQALGTLHFQLRIDGYGFSVVSGRPHLGSLEYPVRLYVQCDPLRVRRIAFDDAATARERPDPEIVDRLSFILGRLAYTPEPRQGDMFQAFREGYMNAAPTPALKSMARDVLNRLLVTLE